MNPSSNESGFNAPPAPELPPLVGVPEAARPTPEQGPATAEINTVQSPPPPISAPVAPPPVPAATTSPAPTNDVSVTTNDGVNTTADDTDLIEKEWVEKAKKIVERTRDDPHRQSNELTAVKADYLQQRYGKVIKLDT